MDLAVRVDAHIFSHYPSVSSAGPSSCSSALESSCMFWLASSFNHVFSPPPPPSPKYHCSAQLDLEGSKFKLLGLSSLSRLRTLSLGGALTTLSITDVDLSAVRLRSLSVLFQNIHENGSASSLGRAVISSAHISGLTALNLAYADVHVTDLTALRQLTGLTCTSLRFPTATSDVSLPVLRSLESVGLDDRWENGPNVLRPVPRAVALTLPGLESLDVNAAAELSFLDTQGLWPADLCLQKLVTLRVCRMSALPMEMVHACTSVEDLDTGHNLCKMEDLPRLRKFGNFLLKLKIYPLRYELLPELVRACPHLTDVCVGLSAKGSTDVGLEALAQLRRLKRVTLSGWSEHYRRKLDGSTYLTILTRVGVLALAFNALVESIHVDRCASFGWLDAQSVMREVQRPYLDIRVTPE